MNYDPTDLKAHEKRLEAAQKARKAEAERFADDLKWLMETERGRRIAYWVLSVTGVFRSTYAQPASAAPFMAIAMAHAEGRKDVGYRLLDAITRVCPHQYAKMMKESSHG